ncbi:GspH/FimT family pseudopilin [Aliiglaciecola sp. CAU 1673]|uniref:GspH/FimT family pseudopilin n=1 Tax=Aliiglaciecola sp. CAU 1673 TaxID=3032595 RepID=UPI0023DA4E08|nr:GspH/FimT family pseudopilin [Aliiglaciecola sp. CAU 1673]MDF2178221.1 GspH/FimT family pseudopilin [Aliiglaciecola sp. CAU 1673]
MYRLMGVERGVTLLELMISVAIVSILLTVVGPNVRDLLIRNRITAQVNEISGVVQYARHNAIDQQVSTIVCPTADFVSCSNDWQLPKMVFADWDGSGNVNGNEELLAATDHLASGLKITGPNNPLSFNGNGSANAAANVLLCPEDNDAAFARALLLSIQGRLKLSQDSNNDGKHEDLQGNALSCV